MKDVLARVSTTGRRCAQQISEWELALGISVALTKENCVMDRNFG